MHWETMKITTTEIRRVLDLLLSEFEAHGASEWEIDQDYYWDVPADVRYDPYETPQQLTMGQLSDDIGGVRAIAAGDDVAPLALVWVANILRVAGEEGPWAMRRRQAQSKSDAEE